MDEPEIPVGELSKVLVSREHAPSLMPDTIVLFFSFCSDRNSAKETLFYISRQIQIRLRVEIGPN